MPTPRQERILYSNVRDASILYWSRSARHHRPTRTALLRPSQTIMKRFGCFTTFIVLAIAKGLAYILSGRANLPDIDIMGTCLPVIVGIIISLVVVRWLLVNTTYSKPN